MTTSVIKRKRFLVGEADNKDAKQLIDKGYTIYCISCSVVYKSLPPNKLCKCDSDLFADIKTEEYV